MSGASSKCGYVLGVNSLFTKTGCDRSAIDDMLNAQEGVTDQNLLQYLGIIEARANQLLLTRAFIIKHQVSHERNRSFVFVNLGIQYLTWYSGSIAKRVQSCKIFIGPFWLSVSVTVLL